MVKDGYYECDYCGKGTTGEFYTETGNHVECQDRAVFKEELQDILDLLRTGTAPMSFGMTEQQWLDYKCNKAAGKIAKLLEIQPLPR